MDENKRQFALISAARNSLDIVTAFFDDETDAYEEMVQEVTEATDKDSVDRFLGDVPQEDGQITSRSAWAESRHDGTIQWEIVEVPRQTEPKTNISFVHKKRTRLYAERTEGLYVTNKATVDILHDEGIDLLERMDECFSDWYKTPKGKKAWEDSCHDLNIGDMLTGGRPDDAFTKKYGFVILPEDGADLLSISYDRVFGNKEED